jgi:site-specific recombinase XerC
MERSAQGSLSRKMVEAWLRECVNRSTLDMAVRRAQIVSGFLDWLVRGGYLPANPFAEIQCLCRRQSTAAIVRALVSPDPDSALECLRGLHRVMRSAGIKPDPGRVGPRIHDLRHSFVVHRMIEWYREGVDVQAKLPYLWTYLGHRDLHSTLVYITITQELLHRASERFRAFGFHVVKPEKET